jgi:hypothetical protein
LTEARKSRAPGLQLAGGETMGDPKEMAKAIFDGDMELFSHVEKNLGEAFETGDEVAEEFWTSVMAEYSKLLWALGGEELTRESCTPRW